MILIEALALGLARPGATEFAVMAGRPPCVKIGGAYQPVAGFTPSEDDVLEMLATLGGFAYIDALGPEAARWKTNEPSVGTLLVKAARRGGVVQALFVPQTSVPAANAGMPVAIEPPPLPPRRTVEAPPAPPPPPPRSAFSANLGRAVQGPSPEQRAPLVAPQLPPIHVQPVDRSSAVPWTESPLLERLLADARAKDASDLHLVTARPSLFRVAGELLPVGPALSVDEVEPVLRGLIPARLLSTFERDGSCDFAIEHPEHGRFRANVSRQRTGLKASLRLIGHGIPTLASLGLPAAIGDATHHHQGLIVLTGPTGHGKTSTLAALIDLLNTETSHHLITVEDPIEYVHPRKRALISQREVGTHTRTFTSALKASLREDPDVIVVGELRDTETVRMALSASETGHLVIATMNTPSAAKTIDRLIDLFPPGDQPQVRMGLAGGLRLVVSQRLVRSMNGDRVFAAAEVLPGSIALWNLIRENKTYQIPSLQQRGKSLGIVRLDDSLAELVRSGKVSLDEARAYAEAPDELTAAITGHRPAPFVKAVL